MAAVWWLIGRQLRRRWAALGALALIVALGGTGTLVAAGAADRTAGSYGEYLDRADVGDVVVNPSLLTADIDRVVRDLPGVRSITSDTLFSGSILDDGQQPPRTVGELNADPDAAWLRGSVDGRYTAMDRPALAEGRLPTAPGEAAVNADVARERDVQVGEVLTLAFLSSGSDLVARDDDPVTVAGVERVTVVGVVTLADEVLPDELYPRERVLLSPALAERYDCLPELPPPDATVAEALAALGPRGCAASYRYYSLEMEAGAAGIGPALEAFSGEAAALTADLPRAMAARGAEYYLVATTTADERERVERSTQPIVAALGVLAAVVSAVTAVVFGLAVARELRRVEDDQRQWWQAGMTRPERAAVVAVPLLLAVAAGVAAAVVMAWLLSPIAPVGSVRAVDPSPARELSGWVQVAALALAAACGVGASALSAGAARRTGRLVASRPGLRLAPRLVRFPARPHVDQGIRAAYGGRGARLVLASCGLAAGAFVAAAVFGASLSAVLSTPASYGWPWDFAAMTGFGYGDLDREAVRESLAGRDDVESWTELGFTTDVAVDGEPVLTVLAPEPRSGADLAVLEGRLPQDGDEVALGTRTAADAGVGVGDAVELTGPFDEPLRVRVTGLAVLPPLGQFQADRAGPGNGAVVATAIDPAATGLLTFVGVDLAPGADREAVVADLRAAGWDALGAPPLVYRDPVRPAEIVNVQSTRAVPLLVGGLLAASAVAGLAVAVVVSVRSRRRELAVLRALGFTGGQVRTSVRVQALAIMAVALGVGVPLGVAAGRVLWRAFAFRLGVVTDPSTPVWWIVAVVAGSLVAAFLAAAGPARFAAHIQPATALRAE